MDSDCICLGPGGCSLTLRLRLRPGCVPNHYLPPSERRLFPCLPCFLTTTLSDGDVFWLRLWVMGTHWFRCTPSGLWGFTSTVRPAFGNLPALRVLRWMCKGPGHIKTEVLPLDCGRYHGCLYEPMFGMPFHITQQGLSPPPEHGREVCLFSICLFCPVCQCSWKTVKYIEMVFGTYTADIYS